MSSGPSTRRVLLTGGSSGIGLATAEAFLGRGYEVISLAQHPCPIRSAALRSIELDLADAAATKSRALELAADAPSTTIVHCAGAIREKPIEETAVEDVAALASLHLSAALALVQANLPAMKEAHYGRIVLISSRAALGLAKRTAYSSTKAGMLGLVRTWALELAPHGITANAVAPGPIADTRMFHEVLPRGSAKIAAAARQVPVGRFGTPDDVARAVLFFADPSASFVTGQTLFVCGGTSVGSITY
jgi:3-oxoacyl-[acyl-carrier protein] reductase